MLGNERVRLSHRHRHRHSMARPRGWPQGIQKASPTQLSALGHACQPDGLRGERRLRRAEREGGLDSSFWILTSSFSLLRQGAPSRCRRAHTA